MNVFKVRRGYRRFGLNYGLPCFFIDCGVGVKYDSIDLMKKLVNMGLDRNGWVVIRNGLEERGIGTFIEGLKYIGARVEVEGNGKSPTPGWFPMVDRWIVEYRDDSIFNYNALRPRQDMLICKNDIDGFLEKTKGFQVLRAVVVDDPNGVWDKMKDSDVRVYKNERH